MESFYGNEAEISLKTQSDTFLKVHGFLHVNASSFFQVLFEYVLSAQYSSTSFNLNFVVNISEEFIWFILEVVNAICTCFPNKHQERISTHVL